MATNACGDLNAPDPNAPPKFGPNPSRLLHANRKHGLLYNGNEGSKCMRRSQFLSPITESTVGLPADQPPQNVLKGHTVAGQLQSGQIFATPQPYSLLDESNYPQDWWKANRSLRVPRVVIISLLPQWTLLWDFCSIIWKRDIVRANPATGDTNNYTYFQQFNGQMSLDPKLRNYQNLGYLTNTWYSNFLALQDSISAIAAALANDPDPIFVVFPQWLPPNRGPHYWGATLSNDESPQVWTRSGEQDVPFGNETSPTWCYYTTPVQDPWWYPDGSNPANYTSYASGGIPCILNAGKPFFGCNVLHLYIGHFAMKIGQSNNPFQWESWPNSPEGNWQAHTWQGVYTGGGPTPFFNGRRDTWTIFPSGDGYTGAGGGASIYNNSTASYNQFCRGAASAFKANYYEYRNFATHLFPMPGEMMPGISGTAIMNDRLPCKSYGFWFGYDTLDEFVAAIGNAGSPDIFYTDITGNDGTQNKEYEATQYAPALAVLQDAIASWFPLIYGNMMDYYNSINKGTVDFWNAMIADTCLDDFGFRVQPASQSIFASSGALIEYIRNYFANESPS